jgi:hypothetical protein
MRDSEKFFTSLRRPPTEAFPPRKRYQDRSNISYEALSYVMIM